MTHTWGIAYMLETSFRCSYVPIIHFKILIFLFNLLWVNIYIYRRWCLPQLIIVLYNYHTSINTIVNYLPHLNIVFKINLFFEKYLATAHDAGYTNDCIDQTFELN